MAISLNARAETLSNELTDLRAKVDENKGKLPQLVNKAVKEYFAGVNQGAPSDKRPRQFSRPDFRQSNE